MAVSGAAPSFWVLLLGRALLGLGQAGYGPSALAWLSDVFPPSYRSRIIGLHDLAPLLGSAAGYVLGGVLGRRLGWRPVFYLAALPGLLLATLVWRLSEPRKGQSDYLALGARIRQLPRRALAQHPMHGLLRTPTLLATYGSGTLLAFALGGLSYWIPTFGVRTHGFTESQMGLIIGGVTLVSGAAGVLSGGILADRLASRLPAARLLLIGASATLGSLLGLAVILVPSRTAFVGLAAVAIYAFAFYAPCMGPLVHQVTHPSVRATAVALYLLIIHVLGYALAPAVVGWLSDRVGDLRLGMSLTAVASLLGGLLGLWGTRFVARDSQALIQRLQVEVSRTFDPIS
jgi:predicted MFS family arabinose efflux permease